MFLLCFNVCYVLMFKIISYMKKGVRISSYIKYKKMCADFLDLDELYDVHKKQDSNRIQIFKEIYRKCLAKMKHTNNSLRRMECNFQVPTFVWGIPIYDYEELKEYILYRLNENGLTHCYFVDPTTLYMSWKPEHIDKKKYQAAKKKSFGTTSMTPGTSITGSSPSSGSAPITMLSSMGLGTSNSYKTKDSKPTSTMMKFDDIFEVPVNLEKIRKMKTSGMPTRATVSVEGPNISLPVSLGQSNLTDSSQAGLGSSRIPSNVLSKTNPSRNPPSRQLMDSWKTYFDKKKPIIPKP